MKIARNAIQGASGGVVAGAVIGLAEALFLLATTGAPDLLSPFYAVVLYGLFIQGFALVPLARRMNLTLPDPGADPSSAA